jgi:hypothetical protein
MEVCVPHVRAWKPPSCLCPIIISIGFVTFISVESAEKALVASPQQLCLDGRFEAGWSMCVCMSQIHCSCRTLRVSKPQVPKRQQEVSGQCGEDPMPREGAEQCGEDPMPCEGAEQEVLGHGGEDDRYKSVCLYELLSLYEAQQFAL